MYDSRWFRLRRVPAVSHSGIKHNLIKGDPLARWRGSNRPCSRLYPIGPL